jgi:hypothetical protein
MLTFRTNITEPGSILQETSTLSATREEMGGDDDDLRKIRNFFENVRAYGRCMLLRHVFGWGTHWLFPLLLQLS